MVSRPPWRPWMVHALALAVLLAAVAVAFADVLGPDRGLFFRDHVIVFKPRWWAVMSALREGHLPAVTRASPAGVPLEVLPNGTYTPATLLFLFGSFDVVYDLFVALQFFFLAAGAYALAIALGARVHEAVLAAAIAALSGPVLSLENLLVAAQGLAFAPWVLLALYRLIRAPSPALRDVAWLALALGCQAQAIIPEVLLVDLLGGLALLLHVRPRVRARLVVALVASAVLALAVAAVQVMPVVEFLPSSRRGAGFDYSEASRWSVHPAQILELFAPSVWAPRDRPFLNPAAITGSNHPPYFSSFYLGCALPLALFALASRRAGRVLLAVAGLALVISLGAATPLHRLVTHLPLLASSRFPVKYLLLVSAALAAAAPLGLRAATERPRGYVAATVLHAAVLAGTWSVISSPELRDYLGGVLTHQPMSALPVGVGFEDFPRLLTEAMTPRLLHGLVFAALSIVVAALLFRGSRVAPVFGAALVLADLALGGRFAIYGMAVEPSRPPADVLARIAGDDRRFYIATGALARFAHQEGHTYLEDATRSQLVRGDRGYRGVRPYLDEDLDAQSNPISVRGFTALQRMNRTEALAHFGRAGVAWVSVSRREPIAGEVVQPVPGEDPQYLYPIPRVRPYVHAFSSWRRLPLTKTSTGAFRDATRPEAWERALVWSDEALAATSTATTATSTATATLAEPATDRRIVVDVTSTADALVVAREIAMPGWSVHVDGAERPLVTAELGYLGVFTPPGQHHVVFEYSSRAERWWPVTIAGWAIALSLVVLPRRRGRQRP